VRHARFERADVLLILRDLPKAQEDIAWLLRDAPKDQYLVRFQEILERFRTE
jgi:hypothetical protein